MSLAGSSHWHKVTFRSPVVRPGSVLSSSSIILIIIIIIIIIINLFIYRALKLTKVIPSMVYNGKMKFIKLKRTL